QREERLHQFSHDLKNRLGSMWQAVKLLGDLPDGPDRDQVLALAERNYFNGARALEELMDEFAVPRGITSIRPVPVALSELLEKCVANIRFRTEGKQQEVQVNAAGPLTIMGDPDVLQQLFEALLSNASKFSPKGSVIALHMQQQARTVVVEVRDQGAGLSGADLRDIFTRYVILGTQSTAGESQARSTRARAVQWAQVHGGTLTAHSAGEGQGSQFRVTLPVG